METILTVALILFLAALTRSTFGFGDALIAVPLLSWVVGVETGAPVVAFGSVVIAATILGTAWRQADFGAAWRLIAATLVGIPVGIVFLRAAPEGFVKGLLGLLLIAFALFHLGPGRLPHLRNERWALPVGFFAGILGGAYTTNGPPVVVYAAMRRWAPERFRATLQGYFLPSSVTILAAHGMAGLWTERVLSLFLWSLPGILAGILLGGWLNRSLPVARFQRLVYIALLVMGILLLI